MVVIPSVSTFQRLVSVIGLHQWFLQEKLLVRIPTEESALAKRVEDIRIFHDSKPCSNNRSLYCFNRIVLSVMVENRSMTGL